MYTAHKEAYQKAKILHRDISIGNLLIVDRVFKDPSGRELPPEGQLIDWELSKSLDESKQRQQHRTVSSCRHIIILYRILRIALGYMGIYVCGAP